MYKIRHIKTGRIIKTTLQMGSARYQCSRNERKIALDLVCLKDSRRGGYVSTWRANIEGITRQLNNYFGSGSFEIVEV